jgi:hypothetical protein
MGLMDKVKAQATQLAQKTQETARDSKAKFDQSQANKRADALLRDLGALVFAERTGRGSADTQAQIDTLVSDISAHEAQNGINLAQPADQPFGGPVPDGSDGSGFQDPGPTSTLNFGDAPPAVMFPDPGAATSFPGSATSFPASEPAPSAPDAGAATSFPGSEPAPSFPDPGTPTSFPAAEPGTSFPAAEPGTSFPASEPATSFPDSGTATSFPAAEPGTSSPDSGGDTPP